MIIRPGIELANLTDTGCHREQNEDYYCYAEPERDEDFEARGRLAVVADGMGGHEGGQVASGIAVEVVRDAYFHAPAADPAEALMIAFRDAHAAIQREARENPELRGMGTTCTAVALLDHRLYYGHVGDSRLYLLRGGAMLRLTEDHSLVARLVSTGALSAEEAESHPDRNVLTAALGMNSEVPAEFPETPVALENGDTLLVCTDGLHGLVRDREMGEIAGSHSPREACRRLVEMAKERGGFDNITVQILHLPVQ